MKLEIPRNKAAIYLYSVSLVWSERLCFDKTIIEVLKKYQNDFMLLYINKTFFYNDIGIKNNNMNLYSVVGSILLISDNKSLIAKIKLSM